MIILGPSGRTVITTDDVIAALAAATGDQALRNAGITAATRLEGDLWLDSLDLAALSSLLRDRYGPQVDLAGYVAGLDIDEIIGLTVGDVADYVNRTATAPENLRSGDISTHLGNSARPG